MEYLRWIVSKTGFLQPSMAVIESVSPSECRSNYDFMIKQIKEITGANDDEAWQALKEGLYDIPKAIEILHLNQGKEKETPKKQARSPKRTTQNTSTQCDSTQDIIDLTDEKDKDEQDIKKAIALSLREAETSNFLNEQKDLTRALEASVKDSKIGGKRTRSSDFWLSVADDNPHEKKRSQRYPVGLRNVGNTCWFSAVVQSLFHIPAFRRDILHFTCPGSDNDKDDPKLLTVKEMQKLFAFMIGSEKKYIDPSNVIQCLTYIFQEDFNQQDVSEFIIKLLDCLESTFNPNTSTTQNAKSANPVAEMFYGRYTTEGIGVGKKEETFATYPLQIENFENLVECIEGAMVQNVIELDEKTSSEKTYTKELWFTHLPAVLILEFSRFRFNQKIRQPEKIHNKLEFKQEIYMDCFMQENRDRVRELRVSTKRSNTLEHSTEELPPTNKQCNTSNIGSIEPMETAFDIEPMETSDSEESPDVTKLNSVPSYILSQDLRQVHYKLHAVLVHEGEANGGHYWAFIYDRDDKTWRKYNDITVSDVTWEDVYHASVGGSLNSSAYCLIYVKSKRSSELFNDKDCHISEKLRKLVEDDNKKFEKELSDWDKKQSDIIVKEEKIAVTSTEVINVDAENQISENEYSPQKKNHRFDTAKIFNDVTNMVSNAINKSDVGKALLDWCNKEREKLREKVLRNTSTSTVLRLSDVRLEHKAIFMITCEAPDHVINRAILESFVNETGNKNGENDMYSICQEASRKVLKESQTGELNDYKTWIEHHSTFQKAYLSFLNGLDYLCNDSYHESLLYLAYAVKLNTCLPQNGQLDKQFLRRSIALCLWKISEKAISMFLAGSDEDIYKALDLMIQQVIPYMEISACPKIIERIRDRWLNPCLENTRKDEVHQSIEEFLQILFEGNTESPITEPPLLNCELDSKTLSKKYNTVMKHVNKSSHVLELTIID